MEAATKVVAAKMSMTNETRDAARTSRTTAAVNKDMGAATRVTMIATRVA